MHDALAATTNTNLHPGPLSVRSYAYVKATLTTVKQQVTFSYQAAPDAKAVLVSTQPFPLPEQVKRPKASLIFRYLA